MIKQIDGYNGRYFVSDEGKVFNRSKQMSQHENSNGYLRVVLSKNGKCSHKLVHRLVATAFIDKPINKNYINHKDGDKKNNNKSNLEWCTRSENMHHAFENGLVHLNPNMGENHHCCKIDDKTAKEIIRLRKSGVLSHDLAKKYDVSGTTIRNIVYGRRKLKDGAIAT